CYAGPLPLDRRESLAAPCRGKRDTCRTPAAWSHSDHIGCGRTCLGPCSRSLRYQRLCQWAPRRQPSCGTCQRTAAAWQCSWPPPPRVSECLCPGGRNRQSSGVGVGVAVTVLVEVGVAAGTPAASTVVTLNPLALPLTPVSA